MDRYERTIKRRAMPVLLIAMLLIALFWVVHKYVIASREKDQVSAPDTEMQAPR